jgi:hypothetical protein
MTATYYFMERPTDISYNYFSSFKTNWRKQLISLDKEPEVMFLKKCIFINFEFSPLGESFAYEAKLISERVSKFSSMGIISVQAVSPVPVAPCHMKRTNSFGLILVNIWSVT